MFDLACDDVGGDRAKAADGADVAHDGSRSAHVGVRPDGFDVVAAFAQFDKGLKASSCTTARVAEVYSWCVPIGDKDIVLFKLINELRVHGCALSLSWVKV